MTLFEKIIAREIPANFVYEDELAVAFHDISPQAPTHILIIPRQPIPRVGEAGSEDSALLGHLLIVAGKVATDLGVNSTGEGFRLVINNGRNGGEAVPHLHVHLLAGRPLKWPPG
jgi:histidine triad (HIT) family protein